MPSPRGALSPASILVIDEGSQLDSLKNKRSARLARKISIKHSSHLLSPTGRPNPSLGLHKQGHKNFKLQGISNIAPGKT